MTLTIKMMCVPVLHNTYICQSKKINKTNAHIEKPFIDIFYKKIKKTIFKYLRKQTRPMSETAP